MIPLLMSKTFGHLPIRISTVQFCLRLSSSNTDARPPDSDSSSGSSSDSSSDSDSDFDASNVRLQILQSALNFVPEYGWTKKSLAAGAKSIGLSPMAQSMLTHGGAELVLYFNYCNNLKLEKILKKNQDQRNITCDNDENYLYEAMKTRLEMTIPFINNWSEALGIMAAPQHIASDLELLTDMANKIWFYSGDKNVNMKWYSRRLSLAAAYRFAELSLIQDSSEGYKNTHEFLERQISRVVETDSTINQIEKNLNFLSDFSVGALTTVRNILGMRRM